MKLNNPFIQSIGLLVMLAELPAGVALKSSEVSQQMNVSHSYLLKVAKKLKDVGLIDSSASKKGGYTLKKPIDEISFLTVFEAVEGTEPFTAGVDLSPIHTMFISDQLVEEKSQLVNEILSEAEQRYRQALADHKISEIVPRDKSGRVLQLDWKSIIEKKRTS